MPTDDTNNIPAECMGVTGPVNLTKPDKHELVLSQQLELAIKNLNIFESVEETRQRREALIELQDLCNVWIYKKAIDYMYPESVAKSIKGKIFTFGSYRLGVNFSGADIDALLVGPKFIGRDEFFDDFVAFLAEHALAQEIHAVPKAFVPVLKMKFCQVEIDLLFASVDLMSIPHDFCLSDNSDQILRNMDERDVRSVNGVRVTDDILRLVHDKKVFKSALKIIRIWAKRRCIYSNAMGFLGGVSWAILVARICQLWPLATVSTVVKNFFRFYGLKWPWPSPVVLKDVEASAALHLVQWDPRVNPGDQNHVMPILTPSYPSQNSTYNVCESHKRFVLEQMQGASELLRQIFAKEKPFTALFKPLFFFSHRHYLVITFRCADRKQFREETSLIESKLRLLVQYLEGNTFVDFALLYLRSFDRPESYNNQETTARRWFIGLKLKKVDKSLYLVDEINRFKNVVKVDVDVSYSRRGSLIAFLPPDEVERIRDKVQQAALNDAKKKRSSDIAAEDAAKKAKLSQPSPQQSSSSDAPAKVEQHDVSSSSTVVAKCSSTEDAAQLAAMGAVSSTTEHKGGDDIDPDDNADVSTDDAAIEVATTDPSADDDAAPATAADDDDPVIDAIAVAVEDERE